MRSRAGIALQGIGVLALGTVVYFAFLHPGGSDPPSTIQVQDPPVVMTPGETNRDTAKPPKPKPKKTKPTAPRHVSTVPPVESVVTETVDTPADSQYESSVARLLGRLAHSGT